MDYTRSAFFDTWESVPRDKRTTFLETHTALGNDLFREMQRRVSDTVWNDARKALDLAYSVHDAARLTEHTLHHALALIALGDVHTSGLESYHIAADTYDKARTLAHEAGDECVAMQADVGLAYVLGLLGRYPEALEHGSNVRTWACRAEEWELCFQATNTLAVVHARRSEYKQALTLYDESREVLQRYLSDHPDFARHLIDLELNCSHLFWRLNRYYAAVEAATSALKIPEIEADRYRTAKAIEAIGLATLYLGHPNDARANFKRARRVFEEAHLLRDVAQVTLYEAKCLLALNEPEKSETLCSTAVAYFESVQLEQEAARALVFRAMARRRQYKHREAHSDIRHATKVFEAHGDKAGLALTYTELAHVLLQTGMPADAAITAEKAEALAKKLGLSVLWAWARLVQGDAALQQEDLETASTAYRAALAVAQQIDLPWLVHRTCYGLATLAARQERFARALHHIDHAIVAIERMISGMPLDMRVRYVANNIEVYTQATWLALKANRLEAAFEYAELAQSHVHLDMFRDGSSVQLRAIDPADEHLVHTIDRLRERRRQFEYAPHEDSATSNGESRWNEVRRCEVRIEHLFHELQARNAAGNDRTLHSIPSLDVIQEMLSEQTRLIEYFALEDDLWAFVVGPESIDVQRISAVAEVDALFGRWELHRNYAASLDDEDLTAHTWAARKLLSRMYDLLLAPIAPLLETAGRLYVVPHGKLHYIPFAALYDVDQRRYLVERFSTAHVPGAGLLPVLGERRRNRWSHSALVLGNSLHGQLPLTLSEAQAVGETVGGDVYLEDKATTNVFLEAGPERALIHVAAHGVFRPDMPLFSSIYLADGSLTILDILDAEVPTGFLAFSACESGLSVVHPGDEIMGLSRTCLHAGAQSLLLSLWRIDDRRTHDFMISFYNYLVWGVPPAEALTLAQREHLAEAHSAHPFYWGAFFVVGDAFYPVLVK